MRHDDVRLCVSPDEHCAECHGLGLKLISPNGMILAEPCGCSREPTIAEVQTWLARRTYTRKEREEHDPKTPVEPEP